MDASGYAYKHLNTPDAVMMVVSSGATAWLAAAGGRDRASGLPLLPVTMGLKILGDAATAAELGRKEWQENRALCAYCQGATLAPLASIPLAFPGPGAGPPAGTARGGSRQDFLSCLAPPPPGHL